MSGTFQENILNHETPWLNLVDHESFELGGYSLAVAEHVLEGVFSTNTSEGSLGHFSNETKSTLVGRTELICHLKSVDNSIVNGCLNLDCDVVLGKNRLVWECCHFGFHINC